MLHAYFYTICPMFRYTSWHFYAFSGTNLLTSCHSASSLFSAVFCVSEVIHRKYSRNWMKQVPKVLFVQELPEIRRGVGEGPQARLTPGWRGPGPGPIKTPRREKPKYPINFPETHRDLPPSLTRDRKGPEALPGTLPERGIATGGLLHCHACLRSDE
jgi:hypothetical protein